MTDRQSVAPAAVSIVPDIPAIYIDGTASHTYGPTVSKIYVSRHDPDPNASRPSTEKILMQLVISNDGLLRTVAFLEHRIKTMIAEKVVTQAQWDTARQFWVNYQEPKG